MWLPRLTHSEQTLPVSDGPQLSSVSTSCGWPLVIFSWELLDEAAAAEAEAAEAEACGLSEIGFAVSSSTSRSVEIGTYFVKSSVSTPDRCADRSRYTPTRASECSKNASFKEMTIHCSASFLARWLQKNAKETTNRRNQRRNATQSWWYRI